jgi:hypothetical protein
VTDEDEFKPTHMFWCTAQGADSSGIPVIVTYPFGWAECLDENGARFSVDEAAGDKVTPIVEADADEEAAGKDGSMKTNNEPNASVDRAIEAMARTVTVFNGVPVREIDPERAREVIQAARAEGFKEGVGEMREKAAAKLQQRARWLISATPVEIIRELEVKP